jgi:hypothetical protein
VPRLPRANAGWQGVHALKGQSNASSIVAVSLFIGTLLFWSSMAIYFFG